MQENSSDRRNIELQSDCIKEGAEDDEDGDEEEYGKLV
jgi:hypothetical protein